MAYIDNSETTRELDLAIRGNANTNISPKILNNSIQPVININPKDYRRSNIQFQGTRAATGTLTAYTTPTDKDFFLSEIQVSYVKNALCDQATGTLTINCTQDGATRRLAGISVLTLTAERSDFVISFPQGIKLDRNTTVAMALSFTAGATAASITGSGYTTEA